MQNRWNNQEAQKIENDLLKLRVYTSRLLGQESDLVLHGGGNTSVKISEKNIFGDTENLLYVKGSGWDLATIETQGFAPVKMDTLLRLATLNKLSDTDMVRIQKSAMTNPNAPAPSVEAILHAIIPFTFVDHTHADAIVAITNTPNGEEKIKEVLGDKVLYIPYVMPGFILARKVFELTQDIQWDKYEGMVLLNHGIFSFSNSAQESYERMIQMVTKAEDYIRKNNAHEIKTQNVTKEVNNLALAELRLNVSKKMGAPVIAKMNSTPEAVYYSNRPDLMTLATQGPLTPDHVIHTKRVPLVLQDTEPAKIKSDLETFEQNYKCYFEKNYSELKKENPNLNLKCLDVAPRWAVWKGQGTVSFGSNGSRANVIHDIIDHTLKAQQWSEALGGWKALPEKDIFEVEYWELEQAKLKKSGQDTSPLQGKVALVTGAASGIGKSCVDNLKAQGACVVAVDINPVIMQNWKSKDIVSLTCDLTQPEQVKKCVDTCIQNFGGLDIVVANAGIFASSQNIENLGDQDWDRTIGVNLTSQMYLFRACTPYLKLGLDPTIIVIASKNVLAPGPGASAYSASKAGLAQLARVAALELAPHGIRVNMLHPHAVMDTALWTPEILESRAKHYNMTTEQYKKNNLLKVEIKSKDIADLVTSMAGATFGKITGAQIAIDGGSDRII